MRVVQKIISDIKSGENIDLYVTAASALILVSLNVLGLVSSAAIAPLSIAILALLTINILGNRHKLDQIEENTSKIANATPFVDEFPSDFVVHLEDANDVFLVGVHHSAALTAYYHLFERKISSGGRFRFLLLDPSGLAYTMQAMRFPGKVTGDQERMRIETSLANLNELKHLAPERVEIRVIDFPLDYTAYVFDSQSRNGIIYVERYTFKTSGGAKKPKFVYKRRDGRWFDHVNTEVAKLWEAAAPWKEVELRLPVKSEIS
jgi:hypothetical protein